MRDRSNHFFACLFVLFLTLGFLNQVKADPITPREAAEWEQHVRRIMRWDRSVDLRDEAIQRMKIANKNLELSPNSRSDRRDLADALHTLGHMAEHDHRFDYSISVHLKALENYELSGLDTRESWQDGREHATEHIFMGLYDEGILLERSGDKVNAHRYFDTAAFFAFRTGISKTLFMSERFQPRFDAVMHFLKSRAQSEGRTNLHLGDHANSIFGEIQCKVLFGNPLGR